MTRLRLFNGNDVENGNMKATPDIPSDELRDAMRFTKSKTKREAIIKAIARFNVGIGRRSW